MADWTHFNKSIWSARSVKRLWYQAPVFVFNNLCLTVPVNLHEFYNATSNNTCRLDNATVKMKSLVLHSSVNIGQCWCAIFQQHWHAGAPRLGTIPHELTPRLICHCGIQVAKCGRVAQRAIISLSLQQVTVRRRLNKLRIQQQWLFMSFFKGPWEDFQGSRIQPFVLIRAWLRSYHLGPCT